MDGVSDGTYLMCCLEDEDITHVLTRCPALSNAWSDLVIDSNILV